MSGNSASASASAAAAAQFMQATQFNPMYLYQLQMAQALGKKSCKCKKLVNFGMKQKKKNLISKQNKNKHFIQQPRPKTICRMSILICSVWLKFNVNISWNYHNNNINHPAQVVVKIIGNNNHLVWLRIDILKKSTSKILFIAIKLY